MPFHTKADKARRKKKATVKKKPTRKPVKNPKKKPPAKLGAYLFGGLTGKALREAKKRKMRLDKI